MGGCNGHRRRACAARFAAPIMSGKTTAANAASPPGFSMRASDDDYVGSSSRAAASSGGIDLDIVRRKAWDLAKQPLSGLLTTFFMMYMAGTVAAVGELETREGCALTLAQDPRCPSCRSCCVL